jgi:serine/threonine-protein kinase
MGVVYRARDAVLQRTLAVKVLLERHRGRADLERRFLEEAQVLGQLQHPAIAPVHALGQLADGRPYFAMKLVKGHTLSDLLAARANPVEDLPRILAVFEQICQALAYAHSKGVIHRDLKPANVMVGAFGEVQIMDWGLAKVLGAKEEDSTAEVSAVVTTRTETPGLSTQAGSVLGTYAYMPPEQARGEAERLDARADVFGLGAVLCTTLTGWPPYTGTREEVVRLAMRGRLDAALARLEESGADAELLALSKACLAAERDSRPANAGAVAEKVAAYRAAVQERLRADELERAAAQARAEQAHATALAERRAAEQAQATARAERRARQRLLLGLALAALLVAVAVGGAGWWQQQRLQAVQRVEVLLARAGDLQRQAETGGPEAPIRLREALDALSQADAGLLPADLRARLDERRAEVQAALDAAERDNRLRADLTELRTSREDEFDLRDTDAAYAHAFAAYGTDLADLPGSTEAVVVRLRGRPGELAVEVAAALDDWALERQQRRLDGKRTAQLWALARALDPDPWRDEVRRRMAGEEAAEPFPSLTADALLGLGGVPAGASGLAGSIDLARRQATWRVLAEAAAVEGLPVASVQLLAEGLRRSGAGAEAEAVLRRGQRRHPSDPWLNYALGHLLHKRAEPDLAEAVRYYEAARAVRPEIGHDLAHALETLKRPDEAAALFAELCRLRPANRRHHNCLGNALYAKGQRDEAIREYRIAIDLDPKLAPAHNGLGTALIAKGQRDEAIRECRTAIDLDPKHASPHDNLGHALSDKGELDEAIREYRIAIDLDPKDALLHYGLGNALIAKGQLDEAIRECRTAIDLDPKLAPAHNNLGNALKDKGQLDEAIREFRTALRCQPDYAKAHCNLGAALRDKGQRDEAIRECRTAIDLDPKLAPAHHNLGLVLSDKGQLDEAIREYRSAIDLDPKYAPAHCNLGLLLRGQGRFEEAVAKLRRGHALGSRQPGWNYPSEQWVQQAESLAALDARLAAILKREDRPTDAAEGLTVAWLCQQPYKQLYATAARFYTEAFAAEPNLADDLQQRHRYNAACAAALAGCGQGKDAALLDDKDGPRMCRQALVWLRADLDAWARLLDGATPEQRVQIVGVLKHWQEDSDLAGVRDKEPLEKLPEGEREAWRMLWAEVEALSQKAAEKEPL